MPELPLPGCAPEPLMGYLKALGVFRLVAEQADPAAKLSWTGGVAQLTSRLDREGVTAFIRDEYRPTPIVGPWGARSGFFPGSSESSAREALEAIVAAGESLPRLRPFADLIREVSVMLAQLGLSEKAKDDDKLRLMRECRNQLPDDILPWFDTAFVITDESRKFPPLLGTGGNEGSGSYVSTFAQAVVSLIVRGDNSEGIETALFGEAGSKLGGLAVGHFDPGALGGPNGSQGFGGGGGVNPWDYLLGIEGSLLFAGAVARRLGADAVGRAGYPFCVEPVAVGYASESDVEAGDKTRAELWLPLWSEPVGLPELTRLYTEGRAQFGRRQARNAVEFALALATLGVSRGLTAFIRYAFVMRYGLSYFAAPLGRVPVTPRPAARLLDDPPLSAWLDQFRRACRDKDKTPARYQAALRQVDRAMFAFANRSEQGNDPKYLTEVLAALGRAERTLAGGLRFAQEKYIRPLAGLNRDWLDQADDGSPEFGLAAALAGVRGSKKGEVGPLRAYLEEVEVTRFVNWSPGSTSAVWSNRAVRANLAAVFRRRQMEAFRGGLAGVPLRCPRPARLEDVMVFLSGDTDDDKLADLLWGLIAVDWPKVEQRPPDRSRCAVPIQFGIPRLVVTGGSFSPRSGEGRPRWALANEGGAVAVPDPDVFHTLAAGREDAVDAAVTRAARRLRSGGLTVSGYRNRHRAGKDLNVSREYTAERVLAAMVFPLSTRDLGRVANAVLYPPETEE